MEVWQLVRSGSRISRRYVTLDMTGSVECKADFGFQVKRVLVPQRENAIINRLNKTKLEKYPDLAMEREEKLKAVRKRDQAARLDRVSTLHHCL